MKKKLLSLFFAMSLATLAHAGSSTQSLSDDESLSSAGNRKALLVGVGIGGAFGAAGGFMIAFVIYGSMAKRETKEKANKGLTVRKPAVA